MTTVKPPGKVKVGHLTYAVEVSAKRCSDADVMYGQSDMRTAEIILNPAQCDGQLRDTTLHEVLHALMDQMGVQKGGDKALLATTDDEERMVHALAPLLLGVLRDNPDLVAFLVAA